ncbi:hypothetical protein D915_004264 [Fasciola hepatica]|uniref:Uncharacterized protein n=1 Tax=Fasciola hepatica TaxID=6192 RepID=A0A4E0RN00_FASHE|nr:hypothetical protein D915_004264 [Fasciola hepatica]
MIVYSLKHRKKNSLIGRCKFIAESAMYRSRMPYIRWHAKGELLKQRMKESMSPRYYRIHSDLFSSNDSQSSDYEKSEDYNETTQENKSKESQEEGFDPGRYKREPIKPIREQLRECQKAKTLCGFGTQSERFPVDRRDHIPPPGTYDPLVNRRFGVAKSTKRKEQPFTKAPPANRVVSDTIPGVGPGIYNYQDALNLNTKVSSAGRFDTSTEIRCGPIKTGYFASLSTDRSGPRFTHFPSTIELAQAPANAYKGKFTRSDRGVQRPHDRMSISMPGMGLLYMKNELAPNTYNPIWPPDKKSFNVKQVSFMSTAARMTKREYQAYIGNVTPFTGPGRYNYPNPDENKGEGFSFPKNNQSRNPSVALQRQLADRLRPKNVPKQWTACVANPQRKGTELRGCYLKLN